MKPTTARAVMIVITLSVVIVGVVVVNSRFHGSFVVGLLAIVVPFLILGFSLPRLLPVRCPRCGGKMRFHSSGQRAVAAVNRRDMPTYSNVV
jgi:hypothetical protein